MTLVLLGETVQTMKLWNLLRSAFLYYLSLNIRLRILFPNTLSQRSSLNIINYVSKPYIIIGNFIVLYILIFKLFEGNREDKSIWNE